MGSACVALRPKYTYGGEDSQWVETDRGVTYINSIIRHGPDIRLNAKGYTPISNY